MLMLHTPYCDDVCVCVCVRLCVDALPSTRRGQGMLMALKMGKKDTCPSIDYCCHRNIDCETQSEAKAKLYIGWYEASWEPRVVLVGGSFRHLCRGELRL